MQKSAETNEEHKKDEAKVREMIIEAYQAYLLDHGTEPPSIYSFVKDLGITEAEFYEHFNHFEQIAEAFWQETLEKVWQNLENDANFLELSVREKMLTFYFEFFSSMRKHRSFFLLTYQESWPGIGSRNEAFKNLKKVYCRWANMMVEEGVSRQEISSRSRISNSYDRLFWYQFLFLLNFWKQDKSKGFEKTDAAIEKSINLSFDLIEKNAIDSALDFGKFMFQNR